MINIYTLDTFLCTQGVLSAQLLYSKDLYLVDLAVLHLPEVQKEASRTKVTTSRNHQLIRTLTLTLTISRSKVTISRNHQLTLTLTLTISRSKVTTSRNHRIKVAGLHGGAGGIWLGEGKDEGQGEGLYDRQTTGGSVNYSITKPVDPDLVGTQIVASTDDGNMLSWNINGIRQLSEDNWRVAHKSSLSRPHVRLVRSFVSSFVSSLIR